MERMRDVLRNQLGRSLKTFSPADRLAAAMPVAAGSAIAARSQVAAYEEGKLTVAVPDVAWQRQLQSMALQLRSDLARVARVPVTDILFVVTSDNEVVRNDKQ